MVAGTLYLLLLALTPFQSQAWSHPGAIARRGHAAHARHGMHLDMKRDLSSSRKHCGAKKKSTGEDAHGNGVAIGQNGTTSDASAAPKGKNPPASTEPATTTQTTPPSTNTTPASPPAGDNNGSSGGLTSAQIAQFLTLHNQMRSQHGATALTWSDTLSDAGKGWADKCVFQHSGGKLGPYGENLAAGTGSSYDVGAAMKDWTDEASQYDPNNPVPSHYTQIVWKGTTQVGCGLAPACEGIFDASFGPAKYFVCEYLPAGNVIGEFAGNVG